MTDKSKDPRYQLLRLSDLLIEDLLATSDADLLATTTPEASKYAGDRAKNALKRAQQIVGQKRLQAARDAVANSKEIINDASIRSIDIAKARQLLENLAANDSIFKNKITLAARNLRDISDSEVLSIIEDLRSLGALPDGIF